MYIPYFRLRAFEIAGAYAFIRALVRGAKVKKSRRRPTTIFLAQNRMTFKQSLRVDNLPKHLKIPVWIYGKIGGAIFSTMLRVTKQTCHWRHEGKYPGSCIHAIWHENIPAYMAYYLPDQERSHVWMQHPNLYMRPIHLALQNLDVDRVYGSSGQGGKEALEELIQKLKSHKKSCTMMAPDGPSGPVKVVKRGALDLAVATSLPIVPIRFGYTRSIRFGWDQKHWPIPWSSVEIIEEKPIFVTKETLQQGLKDLQEALGS
jgi:lysophospholipid acyltransferase (LPLAT)-like uncharacterized protein